MNEIMFIQLTQGKFAIIDKEDFERLSKYNWVYEAKKNNAIRYGNSKKYFMNRFLLNVRSWKKIVIHINGNTLDYRKENLQIVSRDDAKEIMAIKLANTLMKKAKEEGKYLGVCAVKRSSNYEARIVVKRKEVYLGQFPTKTLAAQIYNFYALLIRKEAELNDVPLLSREEVLDVFFSKKKTKTKSSYSGIEWDGEIKKWIVFSDINEKKDCIGMFDYEVEAALYYNKHHSMNVNQVSRRFTWLFQGGEINE